MTRSRRRQMARVGLHQLAPLLLHCVLFGGWYLGETAHGSPLRLTGGAPTGQPAEHACERDHHAHDRLAAQHARCHDNALFSSASSMPRAPARALVDPLDPSAQRAAVSDM